MPRAASCESEEKTAGPARTARYRFVSSTPNFMVPGGSVSPGTMVTPRASTPSTCCDGGTRLDCDRPRTECQHRTTAIGGSATRQIGIAVLVVDVDHARVRGASLRPRWPRRTAGLASLRRDALRVQSKGRRLRRSRRRDHSTGPLRTRRSRRRGTPRCESVTREELSPLRRALAAGDLATVESQAWRPGYF